MKIRSSIKTQLMRFMVWRATFLAIIGCGFLLFATLGLSVQQLNVWGLPILAISCFLIALGLIPYRRLCRVERNPYELILNENEMQFIAQKKPTFALPLECIQKLAYLEKGNMYGIGVWLITSAQKKICILDPQFDMNRFQSHAIKRHGCNLFFPYFSERSLQAILGYMKPIDET